MVKKTRNCTFKEPETSMKMCVVRGDSDENVKSVSFSLPHDNDEAFPSLVPASDTSNSTSSVSSSNNEQGAKHKLFSWRHHDTNKTAVPSRAYSHSVTCARAKVPKPPLPIKAARSAMNCVHPSHSKLPQQQQDHHVPPARAQSKRSSLKQSDSSGEQHKKKVHFGNLEMRNYEIVLGDHPDCSSGPPVSEKEKCARVPLHDSFVCMPITNSH